jgi:hypothetical protein
MWCRHCIQHSPGFFVISADLLRIKRDSDPRLIFFEGLKYQNNTFCMTADGCTILSCLIVKKIQNKVSSSFYEINNCENSSSNPLQEACSGFPIAASDSKSCSKSHP